MNVVITEMIWEEGIDILKGLATIHYDANLYKHQEDLEKAVAEADALIVRNQTRVNNELLSHAPQLKVVGRLGVGLDNIDLKACHDRGVTVIYAKNANATSVAEYVISAVMNANRPLHTMNQDVKSGQWNRRKHTGTEISGKTLGLVGVGEIAHRIAKRAKAFGMKVIGYDPFLGPYDFPFVETGVKSVTFDALLQQSDFISIHVPLTPQTNYLFSTREFQKMKSTSCLINTSRGGVVNEKDLDQALNEGWLGFAVLDVMENEPPEAGNPLLANPNVLLTPHIAGITEASQVRTSTLVATEIAKVLKNKRSVCAL